KLRDALGIKLFLIMEGHRLQREDGFARLIHRPDLVLETLRGHDGAEMTVGVYNYPDASGHSDSTDAGDIGVLLSSSRADADDVGLARSTSVADIDIVTARGAIYAGIRTQCDVAAAGGV